MRPTIVSVSGACSRSGKTALAVTLLHALPPRSAVAVKFTSTDDVFERCPRGTPCVVCDIDVPYRIIEDPKVLGEPGTDTARLGDAAASRVVWTIARRSAVEPAWRAVCRAIGDARLVIMEGSTIVDLVKPEMLLFVAHPFLSPARWKATSPGLLTRADAVIVNVPANESREPSAAVLEALRPGAGDRVRVADVTRPLTEWAPDLAARLEAAR